MKTSEWMARCSNAALQMVRKHEAGEAQIAEFSRLEPRTKGRAAILDKLHQGEWLKSILLGEQEYCRADTRSPKWFGVAIAQHLGLDLSEKNNVSLIKDAIKRWLRHGVISTEIYRDENRHWRKFYVLPKAFRR